MKTTPTDVELATAIKSALSASLSVAAQGNAEKSGGNQLLAGVAEKGKVTGFHGYLYRKLSSWINQSQKSKGRTQ